MKRPPWRLHGSLHDQVDRRKHSRRGDDEEKARGRTRTLRAYPPRHVLGRRTCLPPYLISVSILNIGRYIEITIVPTMMPTPIIRIGSMIEVSDWMLESTSSS